MLKHSLGLLAIVVALCGAARANEEAVRKTVADYVAAFNAHDLQKVAAMWTAEATHVDRASGERAEGREAIAADIETSFKDFPLARLTRSIERSNPTTQAMHWQRDKRNGRTIQTD